MEELNNKKMLFLCSIEINIYKEFLNKLYKKLRKIKVKN